MPETGRRSLPESCPRGRTDCCPLANVVSGQSATFVCVGDVADLNGPDGDPYRHCFKSIATDSMYDYDALDMLDTIEVMSKAMSHVGRMKEEPADGQG